ncbi:MAG: GTP-binding protein, partial [Gemmatimonadaceae bacterium]
MLAGATGVDLALLVVAADEGVMPQTVEHVTILDLLGVTDGVIAITKCDLVDAEWLALVREDVRMAVSATALRNAAMIVTSATTGEGVETLRTAIGAAAGRVAGRDGDDLFRLPVDRVFTVRGTGTVVTGTVWSGRLERDATVRMLPGGMRARVRGLETHGAAVDAVLPGMRAAVALAGVDVRQAARGATLVADDAWRPSRLLLSRVALLRAMSRPLGPRTAVRFHLGTADVGARIVKAGGPIGPGERAGVRIVLDEPVVARAGDRFVLRGASPLVTIGGGIVDDPQPPHWRSRPVAHAPDTADARLHILLDSAGPRGVETASLSVRLGAAPRMVASLLTPGMQPVPLRTIGGRLYASSILHELGGQVRDLVEQHHAEFPMDEGVAIESIRAALAVEPD